MTARFITPPTNSSSISAQQQPTQDAPCANPMRKAPPVPCRQCRIMKPSGDWQASPEVTNLFNKVYYTTLFDSTSAAGYQAATPGMPRQWGITVRRTF